MNAPSSSGLSRSCCWMSGRRRQDPGRAAQQRRRGFPTRGEQGDHHDVGGDAVHLARGTRGGQLAEQIVLRVGRGPAEVLGDVAAQFHDGHTRGDELTVIDQPLEQLGGRVSPFHQLVDVRVGHADQLGHDHHGQAVGHGAHPFDAPVPQAFSPQPVCGLRDERAPWRGSAWPPGGGPPACGAPRGRDRRRWPARGWVRRVGPSRMA